MRTNPVATHVITVYPVPALALSPISSPLLFTSSTPMYATTVARIEVTSKNNDANVDRIMLVIIASLSRRGEMKYDTTEERKHSPVKITAMMSRATKALMTLLIVSMASWSSSLNPRSASVALKGPTWRPWSRRTETL